MVTHTIYYRVSWHDKVLAESYYIISGIDKNDIRNKARKRATRDHKPTEKSKISIRTSFRGWIY